MKSFSIEAATSTPSGGMGYKNQLPWRPLKEDQKFFYHLTTRSLPHKKNVLILGRKRW